MTTAIRSKRKSLIIPPTGGRIYAMGKMRAVFKADNAETDSAEASPNRAGRRARARAASAESSEG